MPKRKNHEIFSNVNTTPSVETPVVKSDDQQHEIHDLLVFKLAYLEERKAHLINLQMLRQKIYDERLMQLKYERKIEMEKIEAEKIRIDESLSALRKELESKHNIKLAEYGYDDELGKLMRLPQDSTKKKEEVSDGTA